MKTLLVAIGLWTLWPLQAAVTVGEWQPIFIGVELAKGEADKSELRPQRVFAVRVDLRVAGIECFATPSNGDQPLDTKSETTAEFLSRHGLQVAINANFFSPCCSAGDKDLAGLAMSKGMIVSKQEAKHNGAGVLLITRDNRATITVMNNTPIPTEGVWTAISGSGVVLADGKRPTGVTKDFHTLTHPRSVVGLSQDRRYLIMFTIDGRQPGYSAGATMSEVVDWLLRFGAHDGINLDGGGSTTLVVAEGSRAVILNRPSGAAGPTGDSVGQSGADAKLRSNGNNFGIFARPLDPPGRR
jgi:Phosphodiester glycosidase